MVRGCQSSRDGGLLYLGFLRAVLGWMVRAAGTGPTRSRAIARTSFCRSKGLTFPMAFKVGNLTQLRELPYNGSVSNKEALC